MASGEFPRGYRLFWQASFFPSSIRGTHSNGHIEDPIAFQICLHCPITHPTQFPTAILGCPIPVRWLLLLSGMALSMSLNLGHLSIPNADALFVKKSSLILSTGRSLPPPYLCIHVVISLWVFSLPFSEGGRHKC